MYERKSPLVWILLMLLQQLTRPLAVLGPPSGPGNLIAVRLSFNRNLSLNAINPAILGAMGVPYTRLHWIPPEHEFRVDGHFIGWVMLHLHRYELEGDQLVLRPPSLMMFFVIVSDVPFEVIVSG